jgi:hypothetical protein
MKLLRSVSVLCAALLITVTTACSDTAPTAPQPAPELSLIGDLTNTLTGTVTGVVTGVLKPVSGLLVCNVQRTYTTTKDIGRAGGTIQVGPHKLVIPRDALKKTQRITATAPAGNLVEVRFEPHGLQFEKKTTLTMSYRECGLVKAVLKQLIPRIVYADDNRNILEVLISVPDLLRQTVSAKTDHFSSYLVAD